VPGAGVETDHGVHLVRPRGEDEHRYRVPLRPDPAAHLKTVELGQADVEQDEVNAVRQRPPERRRAVLGDLHLIALAAQRAGERLGD
jgi:hypothetical protein